MILTPVFSLLVSPHMIMGCLSSQLVPAGKKNAEKGIFVPTDISTLERPKLGGGRGRKNFKKGKKKNQSLQL